VAAKRTEKTQLSRTSGAATVTKFPTRARRATTFRRVQWWPDVVWRLWSVTAVEWVGAKERQEEIRVRVCVGKEMMTWQILIGDLS